MKAYIQILLLQLTEKVIINRLIWFSNRNDELMLLWSLQKQTETKICSKVLNNKPLTIKKANHCF